MGIVGEEKFYIKKKSFYQKKIVMIFFSDIV